MSLEESKEVDVVMNSSELQNGFEDKDVVYTGKVVQITNVSPGATLQQMATLFGFLGTVTDIRLYPSDESTLVSVKICYIKYESPDQCGVAQHLTNTVFIDKPLIVVPINREEIPEEVECLHLLETVNAYAAIATNMFLPTAFPVEEFPTSIPGLPPPPVITTSIDPVEIEEIRRTIFVENVKSSITPEQLLAFFSGVGEVKYLRLCKAEVGKYAFVEFSAVESVPLALQYNGVIFGNRHLRVVHSKSAISKPESVRIASGRTPVRKYVEAVRKPSMDRFRSSRSSSRRRSRTRSPIRRRSRTRSPRRRRSRTKSPPRRRRSRTREGRHELRPTQTEMAPQVHEKSPRRRSRSRSKSPIRKKSRSRSRSPSRRRRSYSRSRSRSRSPKRQRSKSRSKDVRKRHKSRSTSRSPRRKSKRRSRTRSPSSRRRSKKSTSRSPDRSSKKKKKDKDRDREKEKHSKKDEDDTAKELDSLLTKIQNYEDEQKKAQSGDDKKKKKEKD